MRFDDEGHLLISPKEVHQGTLGQPGDVINRVLLPGTPLAIPTHEQHSQLLDYLADRLRVHPRNFLFKGSTKIGFSIAPRAEKVWKRFGPASDLDLAIVDPNYFARLDEEVRHWERDPVNSRRMLRDARQRSSREGRVRNKGAFDCYRFFDLPPLPGLEELNQHLAAAPIRSCCGIDRTITAFVFRDWWGVYNRYLFDLAELKQRLTQRTNPLPAGADEPRPYEEQAG